MGLTNWMSTAARADREHELGHVGERVEISAPWRFLPGPSGDRPTAKYSRRRNPCYIIRPSEWRRLTRITARRPRAERRAISTPRRSEDFSVSKAFLSCDWGTSSFRLSLWDPASHTLLQRIETDEGIAGVRGRSADRDAFRRLLVDRVGQLRNLNEFEPARTPIWVSGMASSSIGWHELPYARLPIALDRPGIPLFVIPALAPELPCPVTIVSGIRSADDVARGEETQVLGLLAKTPRRAFRKHGLVLIPGTHSKHIRIFDDRITDFQTFITGELYELVRRHSVLRHSVGSRDVELRGALEAPFRRGALLGAELGISAALFRVRTNALLHGAKEDEGTAFTSGVLIGAEIASSRLLGEAPRILLAAPARLSHAYALAIEELGCLSKLSIASETELLEAVIHGQLVLEEEIGRSENAERPSLATGNGVELCDD
jgi:2-dehydro-3-deoxygalactonokinase